MSCSFEPSPTAKAMRLAISKRLEALAPDLPSGGTKAESDESDESDGNVSADDKSYSADENSEEPAPRKKPNKRKPKKTAGPEDTSPTHKVDPLARSPPKNPFGPRSVAELQAKILTPDENAEEGEEIDWSQQSPPPSGLPKGYRTWFMTYRRFYLSVCFDSLEAT